MEGTPMNDKDFENKVADFFKNYHDRGMVKWGGFYLSNHVLKLNQKKIKDAYVEVKKEEMSLAENG